MTKFILISSLAVLLGRFFVPSHHVSLAGSYEAFAHIWVGMLIAFGFTSSYKWLSWFMLVLLTAAEVAMFMAH